MLVARRRELIVVRLIRVPITGGAIEDRPEHRDDVEHEPAERAQHGCQQGLAAGWDRNSVCAGLSSCHADEHKAAKMEVGRRSAGFYFCVFRSYSFFSQAIETASEVFRLSAEFAHESAAQGAMQRVASSVTSAGWAG